MKIATLRPGLLVSLKTSVRGGVLYDRKDLDPEHMTDDGAREARWETLRRIDDPAEFERAQKTRSACRALVAKVCAASAFGMLCPTDNERDLAAAVEAARALAAEFNATAARSQVDVYVLTGRIAADDVEAARAIGSEVRELLADMEAGIQSADPKRIREAANKAREVGAMLTPDVQARVSSAIEQARAAAREITRRVEKAGEVAASVVAGLSLTAIRDARFAFLDLDAPAPVAPSTPQVAGLDLAPAEQPAAAPRPSVPAFELD